jgi:hypothetical protein
MARRKRKTSLSRRLHRSFGIGSAVFVIFMVVSGIAINHTNDIGFDQQSVSQPFLLSWYGLNEPQSIYSFAVAEHWLSVAGSQLYLNGKSVSTLSNGVGAVSTDQFLVVAGNKELLMMDLNGRLIERSRWDQPGAGNIDAIGNLPDGAVVVKSMQSIWLADSDLLNWSQTNDTDKPVWSSSKAAPEEIQQAITQHFRGDKLDFEQVLLDIHSGRIFGTLGILIYDLLALAVGFLAISGVILWVRGRRNGKPK